MTIRVDRLYRYPVKGLSPEPLDRVSLSPGEGLPQDRRFAIARATTRFDPQHPEWMHKTHFVMLMRDEKLARLRTRFDDASGILTIDCDGRPRFTARIAEPQGKQEIARFIADFMGDLLPEAPRVVEADGHRFFDAARKAGAATDKYVSIVNLASIGALEEFARRPVEPTRFRANVYVAGAPAWAEHDWMGSEIMLGQARLRVVAPITRCAATAVDPRTAERDLDIPSILRSSFGHVYMGIYAEVIEAGRVAMGDALRPA